jgi:DNA repair protein RecO (recombination protein O)
MSHYQEATGYIIHQRRFKDNSIILEFFSQDQGKISLLAKGIKKNKRLKTQVQYFSLTRVQYFGRSQLKTVSALSLIGAQAQHRLLENTAGLYLNELLHYSLIENDKTDKLFHCYQHVLARLGKEKLTPLLRLFEKELLKYNGFELNADTYKDQTSWLTISNSFGLMETNKQTDEICQVSDLTNFLAGKKLDFHSQKRLNKLMYKAIDLSLNHRKLYARELLKSITSLPNK